MSVAVEVSLLHPSKRSPTHRGSRPTLDATRRPKTLMEHDKQRVGGRVHAIVRLRGSRMLFASYTTVA